MNNNEFWVRDKVGISNEVWINKKENIVRKNYDKNDFINHFGNQERFILKYIKDFKLFFVSSDYIEMNYIDAKSINSKNLTDDLLKNIAKKIKEIHNIDVKNIKDVFKPNYESVWNFLKKDKRIPILKNENFYFKEAMKLVNKNVVICNNDITDGNILVDKSGNVTIIDYEYGGINNYLFDLASFIVKRQINKEQEDIFLNEYFKLKNIEFPKDDFLIIRKFTSYFWSKWAYFKYIQKNDIIYLEIFNWLHKR
ncbi:MAG: hypothetical protein HPAVJP_5790 [Candidatus Hepatoplasma vulgare]|nr:MAG: hypothetical protein HPAVJP_5790 [Candidatus Hepatoplasma sp.]